MRNAAPSTVPAQPPCSHRFLQTDASMPYVNDILENRLQVVECQSQIPKLLDGGSLDFILESSSAEFLCLLESFLHLELSVVKLGDGGAELPVVEGEDLVSFAPFIANTLFKSVQVTINDEEVAFSMEHMQAYEGMVNTILHLSKQEQNRFLAGSGLFLSPPDTHKFTDPTPDPLTRRVRNSAISARHAYAMSKMQYTCPILWPLFLVPRMLPTGVEVKISLVLNSAAFCLVAVPPKPTQDAAGNPVPAAPMPNYNIKIHRANFLAQRYRLAPPAVAHQERILASPLGAQYPMLCCNTSSFTLQTGVKDVAKPLIFSGKLPRMVYVYMVEREATNSILFDPFNFIHADVREVFLEVDGRKFPSGLSYTPEFKRGRFQRDFRLFQRELNYANRDMVFNLKDWEGGYTVFPFCLIPDRSQGCDYLAEAENPSGTVTLHMSFRTALEAPTTVFATMEHHRVLSLDSARKPSWLTHH